MKKQIMVDKKTQYTPMQYAKFLYEKYHGMTPMRLQKVLFYLYKLSLEDNNPIFDLSKNQPDGKFQAWVHGPVIPSVYRGMKFCFMGQDEIEFEKNEFSLSKNVEKHLVKLNKIDTIDLRDLSHKNKAWLNARGDIEPYQICTNVLDDDEIKESEELKGNPIFK